MLKFVAEPSATSSPSASRKTPSPTPQNLTPTKKRRTSTAVRLTLFHTSEVCDGDSLAIARAKGHSAVARLTVAPATPPPTPPPRPPPPPSAAARAVARQAWQACVDAAGLDALTLCGRDAAPGEAGELPGGLNFDVLRTVLASFSPVELCRARAVSRTWYACATCDSLWSPLYAQRFAAPPPRTALPRSAFSHFRRRVAIESQWLVGAARRTPQLLRSGRPRTLRCAAMHGELIAGGARGGVLVWRARDAAAAAAAAPSCALQLRPEDGGAAALALSSRALVVGTRSGGLAWTSTAAAFAPPGTGRRPAWARLQPSRVGSPAPSRPPAVRQLSASGGHVAGAACGSREARVWELESGKCVAAMQAAEAAPLPTDALATVDLQWPLLWTGSEGGVLRLWDLRCAPQAGCLGVIKHAEGCSRLQARGHELISAAASLTETVNCIAARHWDVRKSMAAAAKGGSNTAMQCIRLYCVQGVGAPCALQFDTEKLVLAAHAVAPPKMCRSRGPSASSSLASSPRSSRGGSPLPPGGGDHSVAVFMMRDTRPVLRPVALLGEAGGTQFATFNEQGLLLTGAEVATWDFRPPVGVWELEGEQAG